MANVSHEPVKRAMSRIRELSADEEARRLAFVRERALRDEVSFLNDAQTRGRQEGLQEGRQEGLQEGQHEAREETARNLISRTEMDDRTVAEITGLDVNEVSALRDQLSRALERSR